MVYMVTVVLIARVWTKLWTRTRTCCRAQLSDFILTYLIVLYRDVFCKQQINTHAIYSLYLHAGTLWKWRASTTSGLQIHLVCIEDEEWGRYHFRNKSHSLAKCHQIPHLPDVWRNIPAALSKFRHSSYNTSYSGWAELVLRNCRGSVHGKPNLIWPKSFYDPIVSTG